VIQEFCMRISKTTGKIDLLDMMRQTEVGVGR
jgi:hypothetical protein